MSINNRLKKLESGDLNKPKCFCGVTLIDVCYRGVDSAVLTHCPKCKYQYDFWKNMREENPTENLTDSETI